MTLKHTSKLQMGTFGNIDLGLLVTEAYAIYDDNPVSYYHSKTVMSKARDLYRAENNVNLKSQAFRDYMKVPSLVEIAQQTLENRQ